MTDAVLYDVTGRIATLTLNRPQRRNAGNRELVEGLLAALRRARADDEVRAVILTGAGQAFCSGADLTDGFGSMPDGLTIGQAARSAMEHAWNPAVANIAHLGKPTVAAVNGVAAGAGVGLALACDMVVAAESASFAVVFGPKLAIIPDVGCTWFLPRLVGPARARGLALLGDPLPAATAAEWGMIWQAVPDDELTRVARELAARLAALDAVAATRITDAMAQALDQGLDEQLALEARWQGEMIDRPAFLEGLVAFHEKRPPRFDTVAAPTRT